MHPACAITGAGGRGPVRGSVQLVHVRSGGVSFPRLQAFSDLGVHPAVSDVGGGCYHRCVPEAALNADSSLEARLEALRAAASTARTWVGCGCAARRPMGSAGSWYRRLDERLAWI